MEDSRPYLLSYEGKNFAGTRVTIDDRQFKDCHFNGATLVYFGGRHPDMTNCQLTDVKFEFVGPAKNTVELLAWLRSQGVINF